MPSFYVIVKIACVRVNVPILLTYVNYSSKNAKVLIAFVCAHNFYAYLCTRFQIMTSGFIPKVKV